RPPPRSPLFPYTTLFRSDIKLHEITVPEVKAARDVAGADARIMLDTNCPWTVVQAIEMARRLAPLGLRWLEEPVFPPENVEGLRSEEHTSELQSPYDLVC